MKKALFIVLCYAFGMAAFCVHAASSVSSTNTVMQIDFSQDNKQEIWGKTPHWGLSDYGAEGQVSNTKWWTADSNGNHSVMRDYTNEVEKAARYVFSSPLATPNPQPDYMQSGEDNTGFLSFSTAVALYRTIKAVEEDGTTEATSYPTGYDIFFDQLVQFVRRDERSDESIEGFLPDEAKFACWLPADTNGLVVTAGRYTRGTNSVLYITNYVTASNVETGRWYRLTARTIGSAALDGNINDKVQGLALYLDGVLLACGDDYQVGDDEAAMDDRFRGSPYYAARALFPSLVALKKSSATVRGLGMIGQGAIDEIGVTVKSNPLWPPETMVEEIELQVSVEPDKVTNVCVTVTAKGETEPYSTVETHGDAVTSVTVKPNDSVKIAVKTIDGVAANKKVTYAGNKLAIKSTMRNSGAYNFTLNSTFSLPDSLIVRVDTFTSNFDVDGTSYETVKEALAAAWGEKGAGCCKLSLRRDLTLAKSAAKDNGQVYVLPKYSLTFDLCGHWIRGDHFREEAAIYNAGRFTIVDSVGGGGIFAAGKAIEVASTNIALEVNYTNAVLTLGDREITGDFTVTGRVVCVKGDLILKGGSYVTPANMMPTSAFYLNQYVAPERFYAENDLTRDPTPGRLWSVKYDGRYQVRFEVPHGGADPVYTNVDTSAGAYLAAPAITNAAGYTVTNWYVKGVEPQLDWKLATDAVTNDMTLVGQQRVDGYTISYSKPTAESGWPTAYTVESTLTDLPTPDKKKNYTFVAWHDRTTDRDVTAVGAGATWPGTSEPVSGNLDLVGRWQPDVLSWSNVGTLTETNGYYAGTWRFTVPEGGTLAADQEVVIDEIDFTLVNPLTLPKSAEFLAVTPNGGTAVVSASRPMGYDATSGTYAAATNTFSNGRIRLAYRFSGLVVKAGADNVAQFSTSAGAVTPVTDAKCFLRLGRKASADDLVFGNCTTPDEYKVFCPVYEVLGHVKGDVE